MVTKSFQVGVLGAEFSFGQKRRGVELGPQAIRDYGLEVDLEQRGYKISSFGSVRESLRKTPGQMYREFYDAAVTMGRMSEMSFFLGGDHSIAFGSIAAQLKLYPDLKVLWVDAHGDINTPDTSPSGNLHGMPLAGLLNLFDARKRIPGMEWFEEQLDPDGVALIGVRDLDEGEKQLIAEVGLLCITNEEVLDLGMGACLDRALERIDPGADSPLHLSFDIDSMDPEWAKATGLHVPCGLRLEDIRTLGRRLHETERLVSADFVEINPYMASDQMELLQTLETLNLLIHGLLPFRELSEYRQPSTILGRHLLHHELVD